VGHALVEAEMQNHLILTSKIFPNVVFHFFLILKVFSKKGKCWNSVTQDDERLKGD
jgi:hypothetical protein